MMIERKHGEPVRTQRSGRSLKRISLRSPVGAVLIAGLLLAACGPSGGEATPTLSAETIQTQAVATFAADLTQTAIAMPTATPTPTETPTPTATEPPALTATTAPTLTAAGSLPTSSCYGMAFVADVTIPDNTTMTSGNKFTKTWRVRNNGSCAWESGFKFAFTGGEAMGGSPITLDKTVDPGKETELSVALTAPNTAGTYRGNWRISTASGAYFGDEVYVLIIVGSGASATPTVKTSSTPTTTLAPTETPTSTPEP